MGTGFMQVFMSIILNDYLYHVEGLFGVAYKVMIQGIWDQNIGNYLGLYFMLVAVQLLARHD